MITQAQLRSDIEKAFAPLACEFSHDGDGSLTLRLFDPHNGRVDLVVTCIAAARLMNAHQMQRMIEELRYELDSTRQRAL